MQDRSSHRARVLRYGAEAGARVDDQLAAEEPLEIRIAGQPLTLRRQEGYDHGYFFIATFMEDHLRHHALQLSA